YLQDTWKATPRLTLNGGVRWEPYIAPYDKFGPIALYDQKWFDQNLRSTQFKNAPAGILFTGDPGIAKTNTLADKGWLRAAPRLGLAWDVKGDGLTVVRAAYGMFFDYPHLGQYGGLRDTPPRGGRIIVANPQGGFDDPWAGQAGGNPLPIILNSNVAFP